MIAVTLLGCVTLALAFVASFTKREMPLFALVMAVIAVASFLVVFLSGVSILEGKYVWFLGIASGLSVVILLYAVVLLTMNKEHERREENQELIRESMYHDPHGT